MNEDESDRAFDCFAKAYELCKDLEQSELKAKCLFLMGKTYSKTKNSDDYERIEYLNKSIKMYEELNLHNQNKEYAMCFYYKSSCLQWLEKFEESSLEFDKFLNLLDKMNIDVCKEKAVCLVDQTYNFFKLKKYQDCVQTGLKALEIYNQANLGRSYDAGRCLKHMAESSGYLQDSANFIGYYERALDIFRERLIKHKIIAFSLKKLSAAYGKNGQREKQLEFALEALKTYRDPSLIDEWINTEEMANTYVYVADAYRANSNGLIGYHNLARNNYELALKFYKTNQNLYENEIRKIKYKLSSMNRQKPESSWRRNEMSDLGDSIRKLNLN